MDASHRSLALTKDMGQRLWPSCFSKKKWRIRDKKWGFISPQGAKKRVISSNPPNNSRVLKYTFFKPLITWAWGKTDMHVLKFCSFASLWVFWGVLKKVISSLFVSFWVKFRHLSQSPIINFVKQHATEPNYHKYLMGHAVFNFDSL